MSGSGGRGTLDPSEEQLQKGPEDKLFECDRGASHCDASKERFMCSAKKSDLWGQIVNARLVFSSWRVGVSIFDIGGFSVFERNSIPRLFFWRVSVIYCR